MRFLRKALAGEKISEDFETFSVKGFRLGVKVDPQPKILIAALRAGHAAARRPRRRRRDHQLALGRRREDGRADREGRRAADKEIVARIFVAPESRQRAGARDGQVRVIAYLNVPVYAAFHEWLGRGPQLAGMWERVERGRSQGRRAPRSPTHVVDELIVHGSPEECRAHIQRYVANGVTTPALGLLPLGVDARQATRDLAPR